MKWAPDVKEVKADMIRVISTLTGRMLMACVIGQDISDW